MATAEWTRLSMEDQMMSATGSEESIADRCCNVVRKVTAKGVSATCGGGDKKVGRIREY